VLESRFSELPKQIRPTPNADGTFNVIPDDLLLCITNGRHRVCGAEYAIEHSADGERFMRVWREILAIAPEPDYNAPPNKPLSRKVVGPPQGNITPRSRDEATRSIIPPRLCVGNGVVHVLRVRHFRPA